MAEKAKNITDIEKADAFYDAVMKYKEKIEKTENGLETFEKSGKYKEYDAEEAKAMEAMGALGSLSDTQKEMVDSSKVVSNEHVAREKLLAQKEKYLESVAALEGQIKIAISKYIVDTEKEQKKLEKNKEKYAAYVEEEKAKCEALKAELEQMDKDDVTYEDKKAEVDALASRIESMDKKLASFDESLAKVTEELNKNKEKYKEYIDLAKEDLAIPEEPENEKEAPEEVKNEKEVVEEEPDQEEKVEGEPEDIEVDDDILFDFSSLSKSAEEKSEKNETEAKSEKSENEKSEVTPNSKEVKTKKKSNPEVVYVSEPAAAEPSTEAESKEEVPEETDKDAFKRIYKQIKKKETLSIEDTDKMIALLSDKKNFRRFRISTKGLLPFLKSKGEKIFTGVGNSLNAQIRSLVNDKDLLKDLKTRDIRKWKYITELGHNNPENTIEETLDKVAQTADGETLEKVEATKDRYVKFSEAARTMVSVKFQRGELVEKRKALPEKSESEPVFEEPETYEELETPELSELSGDLKELFGMVKSDVEVANEDINSASKEVEKETKEVAEDKTI